MSYIAPLLCEGAACPMKNNCKRYYPNRHHRPTTGQFFISPPFVRDYCQFFQEKQDAEVSAG